MSYTCDRVQNNLNTLPNIMALIFMVVDQHELTKTENDVFIPEITFTAIF